MNEEEQKLLKQIREHLYKLHKAWEDDPNKDGHCKSSEGYVGVIISYPNWFEADDYLNDEPRISCEVYSYLFGPSRLHNFNSLQEAWDEVKNWGYTPE
jgi:hypothetical protein